MTEKIKELAMDMVQRWIEGATISALGGQVYAFPEGVRLMNTTDLYQCRGYLLSIGIGMRRTDSGGNPTWRFEVQHKTAGSIYA